jgi:hypothetical protein
VTSLPALVAAEVRRVSARRLVRVTVLLAVLAIAIGGVLAFLKTEHISEATYQQRVATAEVQRNAAEQQARACLQAKGFDINNSKQDIPRQALEQCAPNFNDAKDHRFHRTRMKGILQGVTGILAIVAWALSASLIGAEYASRSLTTELTWETRRTRVFLTKAVVAIVASAALAALVLGLTTLAMLPSLIWHGAPVTGAEPSVATMFGVGARGVALAAIAGGMGFAIATVGRNTAAALGAGFGYIIILENILGSSIARWRRWLLLGNVIVFVSGKNNGSDVPGRTVTQAALFLSAVALTLLLGAATAFRTRDVQ